MQWQLASETLRAWADEHGIKPEELAVKPEDLGVRITYVRASRSRDERPLLRLRRAVRLRAEAGLDCAVHKVPVDGSRTYITRAPNLGQFRSASREQHDGTGGVVDQRRLGAPVCGPTLRRCGEPALRDALDGSLMGRRPCRGWTLRRLPVACRHGSSRSTGRMSPQRRVGESVRPDLKTQEPGHGFARHDGAYPSSKEQQNVHSARDGADRLRGRGAIEDNDHEAQDPNRCD